VRSGSAAGWPFDPFDPFDPFAGGGPCGGRGRGEGTGTKSSSEMLLTRPSMPPGQRAHFSGRAVSPPHLPHVLIHSNREDAEPVIQRDGGLMRRAQDICSPESNDRDLVIRQFDETRPEPFADTYLPELLREQVRRRPGGTAVRFQDAALTFRELAERSADLACRLRARGVAADDRVGLFAEPSLDLMVGAWGILFAGAGYLPLSPEYPEERLRYMVEHSQITVIVTRSELVGQLAEFCSNGLRIVTVDDVSGIADEPRAEVRSRADTLAYVIYTSGSTGKPKGVMIEHRAIVSQLRWLQAVHGIGPGRVVLQKTPMSFDAAQWEILAPACGAEVVMAVPGGYRDPDQLIRTIAEYGVTTVQCVPTLLQALLDTEGLDRCTTLTQVFSGGESLSKTLATRCLAALPGCTLVNLYGPTECTINASSFTVDPRTLAEGPQRISIGTPAHHTQFYILDEHRAQVGVGEIGELYIGGIQLARGYLHRPELTADRFIDNPFRARDGHPRLYRTGDLAYWDADGTVQFAGRTDNQVKLRGFRVELDEIRLAIENHDWVKNAAVVVQHDTETADQHLVAFIELNPKEAALMDQGEHGAHHQSKENKLQVKAQLSNTGCRDAAEVAGRPAVDLPGATPTPQQERRVFARKTYRFFEGGEMCKADILAALERRPAAGTPRRPETLSLAELGEVLRHFGQFHSAERLLPKYGYASPGSLYATQCYLEVRGIAGLEAGYHYYHPVHHQLILIRGLDSTGPERLRVHFVGKRRAIEPVYRTNIQEVLEMEAGHMVGLFEEILPRHGLTIRELGYAPAAKDNLDCADEDHYLGSFEVVPYAAPAPGDELDVYVQAHPGKIADLPAGQYRYTGGTLERVSDELILRKHVIAINQQVYERAGVGVSLVADAGRGWLGYLDLGRGLHRLQANERNLGFMPSGYSSRSGNDLPSARRLAGILHGCGRRAGSSYFAVGGRVSDRQARSRGMKEDAVHMKGPTELIRDDLINYLPYYMMPNRVVVLDALPLTANGKIDSRALEEWDLTGAPAADRPFVAPRTGTESRIAAIWQQLMKRDTVSVRDDFFESRGNSLVAVALVNRINEAFGTALPVQVMFEAPTIEELARRVETGNGGDPASRLVRLRATGVQPPIFCWPGLGGYPMNLRLLAGRAGLDRPFYGVQAFGINPGEEPYATIAEMAAHDLAAIRRIQPEGPYTLWGYSFGARVAFETAYQLEQSGAQVADLVLIAPGSPQVSDTERAYLTILFSVFTGTAGGPLLHEALRTCRDETALARFISARFPDLDLDLVHRIQRVVRRTYHFRYVFQELAGRRLDARITIFRARGDDYSFLEEASGYSARPPVFVDIPADHYSLLREPDVNALADAIQHRL
jgi:indigoidine synthase